MRAVRSLALVSIVSPFVFVPASVAAQEWDLGEHTVLESPGIIENYNKIVLEADKLGQPCRTVVGDSSGFRALPSLYAVDVCFSIDSTSTCDTLKLQLDTGSSDVWAITDECQKVSIAPSSAPSTTSSCWPVDYWDTDKSCCATSFDCNRLTEGYYTDVQKDDDRADNGKMCNGEDCLLDSYAIGCTYGETASAFVNISNDRSTNQQRRVGIVDYIADIEESVTVGIAGMSFSPLATFTQPVLIDDYDYFILALQTPGSNSVMYLNAGLDDVNVTSKSGENMPFYATNVIPYGQTIDYWLIAMPEFNVGSQNICDGQGCAAVVDSGTSLWTVPTSMWDSFLDAVLGSKCSGIYTSPTLGLITCPGTTYDDFPDIRLWFSSDTSSGKGVYQNFTSRQYMTCGTPESTAGACEGGVSTCVLLAEKLDGISGSGDAENVFILGDTFLVGRAVVFDIQHLQIHMSCLPGEGCVSEPVLSWFERLWQDYTLLICVCLVGAVVITILLIVLCCMLGCCGKKKGGYAHQHVVTTMKVPADEESAADYHRLN